MAAPVDMPADFAAYAAEPIRALEKRYCVCAKTICAWRRSLGIVIPPGAPKGNRNSVRVGSDGKRKRGADGPDDIRTCLSCTAPKCTGKCWKVR